MRPPQFSRLDIEVLFRFYMTVQYMRNFSITVIYQTDLTNVIIKRLFLFMEVCTYILIPTRQIGTSDSVLRFHCIQANLFDQFLIFTAVGFLHPIEEPSTGMILEL